MSRGLAAQDLNTQMRHIVAAYPDQHLGDNQISLDPMWRSPFGVNGYMAATLPILLAFACSSAVADLRERGYAHPGAVCIPAARKSVIRQSLGANRMQLVRQMVLEGVGAFHRRRNHGPRVDNVDIEDIRIVLSSELRLPSH